MPALFVTRSGRVLRDADTDQPGSRLRLRTVSRYTDGRSTDRPHLCLSIGDWTDGERSPAYYAAIQKARSCVTELDRRGHVLPETIDEIKLGRLLRGRPAVSEQTYAILRAVLVDGVPIGWAVAEAVEAGRRKTTRRRVQRLLGEIGWTDASEETAP